MKKKNPKKSLKKTSSFKNKELYSEVFSLKTIFIKKISEFLKKFSKKSFFSISLKLFLSRNFSITKYI